jgi:hypothetical protein
MEAAGLASLALPEALAFATTSGSVFCEVRTMFTHRDNGKR